MRSCAARPSGRERPHVPADVRQRGVEHKKRKTRREVFLERLDALVPWEEFEARSEPHYPKRPAAPPLKGFPAGWALPCCPLTSAGTRPRVPLPRRVRLTCLRRSQRGGHGRWPRSRELQQSAVKRMVGQTLVTVGLMFDIIGVALLLAAPRVHPRGGIPLAVGSDASSQTRLRRTWSRLGKLGGLYTRLPTRPLCGLRRLFEAPALLGRPLHDRPRHVLRGVRDTLRHRLRRPAYRPSLLFLCHCPTSPSPRCALSGTPSGGLP